ncbi:uncharacterized protein LOC123471382 [Daphnia magna]|uniref:uncharacterized protein LOC123471382 n=1 Tax=Daphnia magna TaxID=35525 RepID=UPI001E1BCF42|nr:uncharacterized protein LOC123471382 [Daphnia magna]
MDYLGNNKWLFERILNVQGSWLQVTAGQLINLTIVWKESLREVQQCELRLVETGIAQHYLTNNSELERIRDVEQQLDFVYNTTNKKYCNSSEKNYKQAIGMEKVILRLHSLTDTNTHPSKPLEEDIENIADIIRAEISGAAHSQYARDRTTDGINGVAREIRALQCENQVLAHKTCVSYAGSHQQRGVGIPFVPGLAPYLGVSPDRQLFVEFNVDEVRKCTPYMGSVCLFLKPIDRKGRIKSCVAAVFLQKQEGIQRNCHLDSKKWTGIDMFHIGGRNWGYAGKDNVTIVLQCPGKRIGRIDLPQGLPAAGVIKIPRLCSATSDEWVLQASF